MNEKYEPETYKNDSLLWEKDGIGAVEPELYVFSGQTTEEANKICGQKETVVKKEFPGPKLTFVETYEAPKLTFDNEVHYDEMPSLHSRKKKSVQMDEFMLVNNPDWCKLSGVDEPELYTEEVEDVVEKDNWFEPEEFGVDYSLCKLAGVHKDRLKSFTRTSKKTDKLMDKVVKKIKHRFKKLNLEWSNGCLLVNSGKTNINSTSVIKIYKSLRLMTDHNDSLQILCGIINKKLRTLFV